MEQQDTSATAEPQALESVASVEEETPAQESAPATAEDMKRDEAEESAAAQEQNQSEEPAEEPKKKDAPAEKRQKRAPRTESQPQKIVPPDQLDKAANTLNTMLDFLGLDATIRAEGKPGKVNLLVKSEDAGRIIGHKGQTLSNLQLLVNRIMQKTDADFPKLYIDIDGGQQKREERTAAKPAAKSESARGERPRRNGGEGEERGERAGRPRRRRSEGGEGSPRERMLRQQALDAAKEVRLFGLAKTLPPMNSHDRRVIHVTLKDEADLSTESVGDGDCRSVVISLKEGA